MADMPEADDVAALRTTLELVLAYLSKQARAMHEPAAIDELKRLRAENTALKYFVQRFIDEVAHRTPLFTGLAELKEELERIKRSG